MKYNDLKLAKFKHITRLGRGIASGHGKTAGRGTKGQHARTGSSKRPGFEGGQNPMMQRLPKLPGFTSHRTKPENVKLSQIEQLKDKVVDAAVLASAGLISNQFVKVKVIASGEIKRAVSVKLFAASEGAIAAIEKAGGSFEQTDRPARPIRAGDKQSRKAKKSAQAEK